MSIGFAWILNNLSYKRSDRKIYLWLLPIFITQRLINALVQVVGSVWILTESIQKLIIPEMSDAFGMLWYFMQGYPQNHFMVSTSY